jgi:molybdopterin-binding protein
MRCARFPWISQPRTRNISPMKLSARNVLAGKIVSVKKGPISSLVVIEVAPGVKLTASVTADAAKQLKLAKGNPAYAVIKASSVMVGVD